MTILHQILPSPAVPGGGTPSVYVCIKKIGVCVCGGGGVLLDISYRNQIQTRFGKAVS